MRASRRLEHLDALPLRAADSVQQLVVVSQLSPQQCQPLVHQAPKQKDDT
jgi:hypothetical protein